MTGLVRRATLITAAGLLAATAAMAGVPSATTSSQPSPSVIKLVGHGSPPDPAGNVLYTIRDASNNPVPGSVVILNFAGCGDSRICQSDVLAGLTVNCSAKTVTGVTNASGQITVAVVGTGTGVGPAVFVPTRCVTVTADGVPLSNLNCAVADLNGVNGVNGIDLGLFGSDLGPPSSNRARSDYDANGVLNGIDLGLFGAVLGPPTGSISSCTTVCP
jgi:hypothetical protein